MWVVSVTWWGQTGLLTPVVMFWLTSSSMTGPTFISLEIQQIFLDGMQRTCLYIEDNGVWKNWVWNLPPSYPWTLFKFWVPQFSHLKSRRSKHHLHVVGMKIRTSARRAPGPGWTLVLEWWLLFLSLPKEPLPPEGHLYFASWIKKRGEGLLKWFPEFFSPWNSWCVAQRSSPGSNSGVLSPHNMRDERRRGSTRCKQDDEACECAQDL